MTAKSPAPMDKHVGNQVRLRRMFLGISQEKLGEALGVTFQQVQKYEKGVNRISASRLNQLAQVLAVPIDYFYEGAREADGGAPGFAEQGAAPYLPDTYSSADSLQLVKAFNRITDAKVRRRIVDLVEAVAATAPA